jgi:hypothetical protein
MRLARLGLAGEGDRLLAAGGSFRHGEVRLAGQQRAQPGAPEPLAVRDHDPDRVVRTAAVMDWVPSPAL